MLLSTNTSTQGKHKYQEGKHIYTGKFKNAASGGSSGPSVEADGVQEGLATILLELQQHFPELRVHVIQELKALAELREQERPQAGLFEIISDVQVNHMHQLEGHTLSGIQFFHHLVINLLFAGKNQVEYISAVLEPFGPWLDRLVSLQHMHNAILCIELSVFPNKISVYFIVSGIEIINIGLVSCWSWKPHMSPCSKGLDSESLPLEETVGFHAPILVAGAHHCHPQRG